MMTHPFQNMDCIVTYFLVGAVYDIKLNMKLIFTIGTMWAVMMLHRPILIPISASGYEELDKIPEIFLP